MQVYNRLLIGIRRCLQKTLCADTLQRNGRDYYVNGRDYYQFPVWFKIAWPSRDREASERAGAENDGGWTAGKAKSSSQQKDQQKV